MGELIDRKAAADMLRRLADRIEASAIIRLKVIDHQIYSDDERLTVEWTTKAPP